MTPGPEPRLPSRPLRGRVLIAEAALQACEELLPTYRGIDGDHEGIAYLCGREVGDVQLLTTAVAPQCEHGRRHVMCDERQIDEVVTAAHAYGLGVLAQVHTHPGPLSEHSEGDDELVLMPFEAMLSFVVPHYARHRMRPLENLGVHQFQDGRWVRVDRSSIGDGITVIPGSVDLR